MTKTFMHVGYVFLGLLLLSFVVGCSNTPESNFPIPENVSDFSGYGEDTTINFQTDMSISEVETFYRDALIAAGLRERKITTVSNETTLNLVMDGYKAEKSVVIQATVLPDGQTNVNVRAENL